MRHVQSPKAGKSEPEPVQVHLQGARPRSIEWRGRSFAVTEVLSTWCIEGRWWLDEERTGVRRRYFRLQVQTPRATEMCVDVFRSHTGNWRLWRVAD